MFFSGVLKVGFNRKNRAKTFGFETSGLGCKNRGRCPGFREKQRESEAIRRKRPGFP